MSEPYRCKNCERWFHFQTGPVFCCVLHSPGDCCHYGEREAEAPPEPTGLIAGYLARQAEAL